MIMSSDSTEGVTAWRDGGKRTPASEPAPCPHRCSARVNKVQPCKAHELIEVEFRHIVTMARVAKRFAATPMGDSLVELNDIPFGRNTAIGQHLAISEPISVIPYSGAEPDANSGSTSHAEARPSQLSKPSSFRRQALVASCDCQEQKEQFSFSGHRAIPFAVETIGLPTRCVSEIPPTRIEWFERARGFFKRRF